MRLLSRLIALAVLAATSVVSFSPTGTVAHATPASEEVRAVYRSSDARLQAARACWSAHELLLPSTCSEIQLRVVVAMGRPQLAALSGRDVNDGAVIVL
ncbi:hypothetical protein GTP44_13610 [Duganella sp. FT50W]|uniref:UrcA family protein n=1 Tax=Duganella lactea TaxID=2692173 RepID=A0A6L8MK55_9BURK|nr:hypothetical protein [Duganella lactea]MYM82989.1 hypothetical protein [Duganella lactea]